MCFLGASLPDDFRRGRAYIKDMSDTKPDLSLKARQDILQAMLRDVPFDGWTRSSLKKAVKTAGLPKGADELYFPGGPLDVIAFWHECNNAAAAEILAGKGLHNMRIRDKVTAGVLALLETIGPNEEAVRRAIARLSLPDALGQGPKHLWAGADMIWRAIGDTSTDGNYYSKRTILSGVIGSTMMAWLTDETPDKAKARKFLDNRIANVMQFEKAKWKAKEKAAGLPNPAEVLGRLRYGTRRRRRRSR